MYMRYVRMSPTFTWYEMSNAWATVSTIVHLPRIFPPTDFLFEKRIGLVSMDRLYIMFTYYTQDNQQLFQAEQLILRVVFGAVKHLPPVWWSNFRLMFLNESSCVSLT